MAIEGAGQIPVSMCGELAGSNRGAELAVKAGIRTLSVAPPLIPDVKDMIRELRA